MLYWALLCSLSMDIEADLAVAPLLLPLIRYHFRDCKAPVGVAFAACNISSRLIQNLCHFFTADTDCSV